MTRPPSIPPLSIPLISVESARDAGTGWQYEICIHQDASRVAFESLIRALLPSHTVCFAGRSDCESYQELRATKDGFEIKVSHHGCSGRWDEATLDEAVNHLWQCVPGIESQHQQVRGAYWIPKK